MSWVAVDSRLRGNGGGVGVVLPFDRLRVSGWGIGVSGVVRVWRGLRWIPACAGMTKRVAGKTGGLGEGLVEELDGVLGVAGGGVLELLAAGDAGDGDFPVVGFGFDEGEEFLGADGH